MANHFFKPILQSFQQMGKRRNIYSLPTIN